MVVRQGGSVNAVASRSDGAVHEDGVNAFFAHGTL